VARDTGAQCKQCRREGQKLFLKGERCFTDKCGVERRSYPAGEQGRGRMRQSEYRLQLREMQKTRRYYQILEKQFRSYYDKASRHPAARRASSSATATGWSTGGGSTCRPTRCVRKT
jgi:small subunit ribosomal protein S4